MRSLASPSSTFAIIIRAVGTGGSNRPQIVADQFTLFQPGGQIMHTTLLLALPEFSDLPTALNYMYFFERSKKIALIDMTLKKKVIDQNTETCV